MASFFKIDAYAEYFNEIIKQLCFIAPKKCSYKTKNPHLTNTSEDFKSECEPAGIRTQDPYIKSVMLYQLSYGFL